MTQLPLEDGFSDVLLKAMRGLKLGDAELAARSGIDAALVQSARKGKADDATLRALAPALQLCPAALIALARGTWHPAPVALPDGFAMITTKFEDTTVNAYLAWDRATKRAVVFDTGMTAVPLLAEAKKRGLKIELILLTHTHRDHLGDVGRLREETGAPVWSSEREPYSGGKTFVEGHAFTLGDLGIRTLSTWGHTAGGATFVIHGLNRWVAVTGDSIFAGSIGGALVSYDDALRNNAEKILRLPEGTILACGHGPLTTVGEEKRHNPFFAARR